ncbi:ATP synthase subunit 8 (mitochondrion) [Muscidifurax raptorellus]|uniref:ATP synthase F0 subunit 8 n=1 Tax=Muscidifurax raptorellus TaxID=51938 RepID=UPI001E714C59|nr:ATP synthase F0 subunit 8 [Muscidifurax raptorellus]UAT98638.1 ATP synthase subunit 8 [Muscidifurax raptorellus]
MPQMSPMLWINLYMYIIISLMIFLIMLNSLMMYMEMNFKQIKLNYLKFLYKWY